MEAQREEEVVLEERRQITWMLLQEVNKVLNQWRWVS